jgi:hypothetical protein
VELIVGTLLVLGLLAIFVRFAPRTPSGEMVLPRVIDNSIGMWTLRRVTGLRLWERPEGEPSDGDADAWVADVDRRLAGRAAGSPSDARAAPTTPTRPAVWRGRPDTRGVDAATARRVALLTVTGQRERAERLIRLARARPAAATGGSPPRWAGLGALAALLLAALLLLAVAFQPSSSPSGQVLSATGTPGAPGASDRLAAGGSATSSAEPSGSATSMAPNATLRATAPPAVTLRPGAPPTRTPTAAPKPTRAPTPTATSLEPSPTPPPTAPPIPTPTPTPLPPVARIACTLLVLQISCDGSASERAVTYSFTFGDGDVVTGSDPIVDHTYLDLAAAGKPVELFVTDALGQVDMAEWSPP